VWGGGNLGWEMYCLQAGGKVNWFIIEIHKNKKMNEGAPEKQVAKHE